MEEKKLILPLIQRTDGELTKIVSIGPDWQIANKASSDAELTPDGRYVAFASDATNLLPGDTNGRKDIFVVDRSLGSIRRASLSTAGDQASSGCDRSSISGDGRYVVFQSSSISLVSGDTNAKQDIFLRDMQSNQTTLVSVSTDGVQSDADSWNPKISSDGRYIVYETYGSTLVANDLNATDDIFIYDRQLAQTTRISLAWNGAEGNDSSSIPVISADGRYIVFTSNASNLVESDTNNEADTFWMDRQEGQISRISIATEGTQGNGGSGGMSITDDGRFIVFGSYASNLVSGDTNGQYDIFVRDRQIGTTERVSISSTGAQGNDYSIRGRITSDGRYVFFDSLSSNLVAGDTNASDDVFLRDRQAGTTTFLSLTSSGRKLMAVAPPLPSRQMGQSLSSSPQPPTWLLVILM